VSNVLTDWRTALVDHLDANLQGGSYTVLSGPRDGATDRKLACVFVPAWQQARDVSFGTPPMIVRAWVPQPTTLAPTSPQDPGPLEQLAVDLMTTLQPVQTTLLAALYFWVAKIRFDYDDWGVEATLQSYTRNLATLPA